MIEYDNQGYPTAYPNKIRASRYVGICVSSVRECTAEVEAEAVEIACMQRVLQEARAQGIVGDMMPAGGGEVGLKCLKLPAYS